jgi:hypothetical protein
MPNRRPLSKARITAKKRETHRGFLIFWPTDFWCRCSRFCDCPAKSGSRTKHRVKYWEIIADKLSKAGWSWGCVATVDSNGQTIFVADAHRDDGKRFVVHSDNKLSVFLELERITHELAVSALLGDHTHWDQDLASRLMEEN